MGYNGKHCKRLVVAAFSAGVLLACNQIERSEVSNQDEPTRGGVYRVGVASPFGFTSGFDPSGEYYNVGFNIYSNLLLRTLVGYRHVAGAAGNELVPDLATEVPSPTDDGLTYTFHLKPAVEFGPR